METTSSPGDAERQLAALDGAVDAVRRGGYPRSPNWYWIAIASVGPAVVAFETQPNGTSRFIPVLLAGCLVAAVGTHTWRRLDVRPKRSLRTRPQLVASFAFTFAFIIGLQLASALAERLDPVVAAALSYTYLVAATAFLGRRAESVVWTEDAPTR